MADSCRHPVGRPVESVTMTPPAGAVDVSSSPAAVIAFVFTHAEWWSALSRIAGRSGQASSRMSVLGSPPGKWAIDQPPPMTQSFAGSVVVSAT